MMSPANPHAGTGAVPSSAVTRFTDPYSYQESFRGSVDLRIVVTGTGNYQAELARVSLGHLSLTRGWVSLPRIVHSAQHKGRVGVSFLAEHQRAPSILNGLEAGPEHMAFFSPGGEVHQRSTTECHWGGLSLAAESLAAAGRTLVGCDWAPPAETRLLRPPPSRMSRLRRLCEAGAHLAATVPDLLARPEVARGLEQELVRAIIGCLTEGQPTGANGLRPSHGRVLRRLEEFLAANPGEPLYLTDVCAAIGVAIRTLNSICHRHWGIGPQRYLRLRRMQLVRHALSLADPADTTVTAIALDHGFWELGRFAVAYKQLFGESPSVTLRRPTAAPSSA